MFAYGRNAAPPLTPWLINTWWCSLLQRNPLHNKPSIKAIKDTAPGSHSPRRLIVHLIPAPITPAPPGANRSMAEEIGPDDSPQHGPDQY